MLDFEKKIFTALEKINRRGADLTELMKKSGVSRKSKIDFIAFKKTLTELIRQNLIIEIRGRFILPKKLGLYPGEVVKVNETFGFARINGEESDVFVPGSMLKGSLPGDLVLISKIPGRGNQLEEGKIYAITKTTDRPFSGIVSFENGEMIVIPDNLVRFPIKAKAAKGLEVKDGEKVLAKIVKRGDRHYYHRAEIIEVFGSPKSAAVCAKAILAAAQVREEFPSNVLEQAKNIDEQREIHPKEILVRKDYRDKIVFTIDGADSKDLDDAISIEVIEDGWELGVHIADVSYYIFAGTPIDEEALERGTSIYYADSVIPMLPKELSNGICSLNPNEDRLAFSAIMKIDSKGNIVSYRFEKCIINSVVKGVYSEVNSILEGTETEAISKKYEKVKQNLFEMQKLAKVLRERRFARGSVDLESVESKVILDENGMAVDIVAREQGISENIIEEFMLAANQAAASKALEKNLPFVFRIHEDPSPEKIEGLFTVLDKLGISYKREKSGISSSELSKILAQVKNTPLSTVVNMLILRSMAKAKYNPQNKGHFGLALEKYAHFTAPIRRYSDLAAHRVLSGYVTGMKFENIKKRYTNFCAQASVQATNKEIEAMNIERNCESCYKAEYIQRFIGEEFEGIIISAASYGVYVQLPNTVEGLVRTENLISGDWEFDGSITYTDRLTSRKLSVGDNVKIRIMSAEVSSGKIDFEMIAS